MLGKNALDNGLFLWITQTFFASIFPVFSSLKSPIMKQKHKMIVVFLIFLLVVIAFGLFVKSNSKQPEKPSENPSDNQWLFPDCPGITAKFLDLHPDFKTNRNLLRGWAKEQAFTYHEIKAWLESGFKPDESDFVHWICIVKTMQFPSNDNRRWYYSEPRWLKDNVNIDELRNEYKIWKENQ